MQLRAWSSFDVRKMLGCCGQIARRWHCIGARVFVFLPKDKGDSLCVTPSADEKKVRSFQGVPRRVRLVAWLRKWCRMAVIDALAASVAGYGSHSPEVLHFGPVLNVQRDSLGKKKSLISIQQISHNRPAADWGNISVARYHLRVNTVSQARMYKLCSLTSDWQRVHVDMTVNSFFWPWITARNCLQNQEHQRASWFMWRTRLKTGQFIDIGIFGIKAWLGMTSFSWKWCR